MTMTSRMRRLSLAGMLCIGVASSAEAGFITLGARIPITPTSFALPVEVVGVVELSAWEFDLAYDPTDVQIHTLCDPFVDSFCGFLTSYTTEGPFYASGAPFNVLNQGAVLLDGALQQTGVLLAAQGAYGGFPPAPSGDGVIAYVHFLIVGTGDAPITVENPVLTQAAEPASVLLLTAGFAAAIRRRCTTRGRP